MARDAFTIQNIEVRHLKRRGHFVLHHFYAGVTADLNSRVKAGELVNFVALQVGGKGGGRADMAQAGGTLPAQLPEALASVAAWVEERL